MSVALGIVLFGCLLGFCSLIFLAVYKLSKWTRYRTAIRAGIIVLCVEISALMFVDDYDIPLVGVTLQNGWKYLLDFSIGLGEMLPELAHGRRPDIPLILLLPLLATLLGLRYDRQRQRVHQPSQLQESGE
jgi:hypothetical protein